MSLDFKITPFYLQTTSLQLSTTVIEQALGKGVPAQVIAFWEAYEEVAFANSINIYGFETVIIRNEDYQIGQYVPDYLLIGDDGGGQGLFVKRGDEQCIVHYLGLGALDPEDFNSTEMNLIDWISAGPVLEEEESFVLMIDVWVTNPPADMTKFIMAVRKELKLNMGIQELKDQLQHLPYKLLQHVSLNKYGELIESLNERFHCLTVEKKQIK